MRLFNMMTFTKNLRYHLFEANRYLHSTGKLKQLTHKTELIKTPEYISICPTWPPSKELGIKQSLLDSMIVIDNFVTEQEETNMIKEVDPYLKKLRYEYDHWDDAIHGFRETERRQWNEQNSVVIDRVIKKAFTSDTTTLELVHVLDLAASGYIKPHVDSVRFCGSVIAGICLLSDAVMKLVHEQDKQLAVDVLLRRRSLYIIKDTARYDFTHEILPQELSIFNGNKVIRTRRVSIICRSTPQTQK